MALDGKPSISGHLCWQKASYFEVGNHLQNYWRVCLDTPDIPLPHKNSKCYINFRVTYYFCLLKQA